jgi:nicotinamidase-related amidase
MKTTLVVIDVQNYFVNDKTNELPAKIADFIENNKFDYILFTQFVNNENSNFVKLLNWRKCFSSPDIDIHPTLTKFITPENTFRKTAYSIFKAAGFTDFLKKHDISKLFLCGIDTDSCVLASSFDAFDLGYEVKVIKNLCQSYSGSEYDNAAGKIIDKSIQKET